MNFGTFGIPVGLGLNSGLFSLPTYKNLWTPTYITTQLWLDSAALETITISSGIVNQWKDKSGNNHTFSNGDSSACPSYVANSLNNLPALMFDGVNDTLSTSIINTQSTNTSTFVVSKPSSINVKGHTFKNGDSDGYAIGYGSSTSDNNGNSFIYLREAIQWHPSLSYGGTASNIVSSILGDSTIVNYLNGNNIQTIAGSPLAPSGNTYIGGSRHFSGNVFEVIFCSSVLTNIDRQKVEGYLAHKWGLTASLPNTHLYKSLPPLL
jgi:hypothetical protein